MRFPGLQCTEVHFSWRDFGCCKSSVQLSLQNLIWRRLGFPSLALVSEQALWNEGWLVGFWHQAAVSVEDSYWHHLGLLLPGLIPNTAPPLCCCVPLHWQLCWMAFTSHHLAEENPLNGAITWTFKGLRSMLSSMHQVSNSTEMKSSQIYKTQCLLICFRAEYYPSYRTITTASTVQASMPFTLPYKTNTSYRDGCESIISDLNTQKQAEWWKII